MRNTTTRTTPNLMAIDLAGCRINSDTPQYLRGPTGTTALPAASKTARAPDIAPA